MKPVKASTICGKQRINYEWRKTIEPTLTNFTGRRFAPNYRSKRGEREEPVAPQLEWPPFSLDLVD